jgi:hypothetical protein
MDKWLKIDIISLAGEDRPGINTDMMKFEFFMHIEGGKFNGIKIPGQML